MEKEKIREARFAKMAKDCGVMLEKLTKYHYGTQCPDHAEECVICSAYLLLREYKRLHLE